MSNYLIKLAGLYENESKAGNRYFVGLLNSGAKLVMLANKDRKADNEPHWHLFLSAREKPAGDRQGGDKAAPPPAKPRQPATDPLPFDDPIPPNLGV